MAEVFDLNPETARLCDDQPRPGMRCLLPRGHAGQHEFLSIDGAPLCACELVAGVTCVLPKNHDGQHEARTSASRSSVTWK